MAAFDSPGAPWWAQGQILPVTPPDTAVPRLSMKHIAALLSDDWVDASRALECVVAARPGVDGDLVGLATHSASGVQTFIAALGRQAQAADLHFKEVSESEFTRRLAE
jgi:hypothetical protein